MVAVRLARMSAAVLAVLGIASVGSASCSTHAGLVVALQTDMKASHDFASIGFQIYIGGTSYYDEVKQAETTVGDEVARFPATVVLLVPEDPDAEVKVRVFARRKGGDVVISREAITTVPADRLALLTMPLQFLCLNPLGSKLEDGTTREFCVNSSEETCIEGTCVDKRLSSDTLPDFAPELIYGGGRSATYGQCFDAEDCFTGASLATIDMEGGDCAVSAGGDVNVGLLTRFSGYCGGSACVIPLDVESFSRVDDSTIQIPSAVCEAILEKKVLGVVTAPLTSRCSPKTEAMPMCGPFSLILSSSPSESGTQPNVFASGGRPVSLAIDKKSYTPTLYWVDAGTEGQSNGVVYRVSFKEDRDAKMTLPEEPAPVAEGQASPRSLAVQFSDTDSIYWTNAGIDKDLPQSANGSVASIQPDTMGVKYLIEDLMSPRSILADGDTLFWSQPASVGEKSGIFRSSITSSKTVDLVARGIDPYDLAYDDSFIFWTDKGQGDVTSGSVRCAKKLETATTGIEIASNQLEPRGIVTQSAGADTYVYWTSFGDPKAPAPKGTISRARVNCAIPDVQWEVIVDGLDRPRGIEIFGNDVYWTNEGLGEGTGSVMRYPKALKLGESSPCSVATQQNSPGAIVVSSVAIVWINEGSATKPASIAHVPQNSSPCAPSNPP